MTGFNGSADDLRRSYLQFMEGRGSRVIPSASLLPENDPTTLFTGSGMQPMIPYLLGEKHPSGNDVCDVQKCIRTKDIDIVGDNSHLTFFEMTGRWILGADPATYKREQITAMWEWQVGVLGLDPRRFYATVYQGNEAIGIAKDDEAIAIWSELFRSVGIDPVVETDPWTHGASRGGRIFCYDEGENWWSRAGRPENMPMGEPGGGDSEMFFDFDPAGDAQDHPATDTARFLEIGNNVFMSVKRTANGFEALPRPNIDYGGGLERISASLNGDPDIYLTVFFKGPAAKIEELSGKAYRDHTNAFRIIMDHARAGTFLIADGAPPSNTEAGYITRRLLRRAIRTGRKLDLPVGFLAAVAEVFIDEARAYPALAAAKAAIMDKVRQEEEQFHKTLQGGEREIARHLEHKGSVTGADAFHFYETYGFPLELTEEFLAENGAAISSPDGFQAAMRQHSDLSRTAAAGKFKGGLADHSEKTTALHTATHLMLAGLRQILGTHVWQKGSNITAERARFDFSHPERMTDEQKQAVEQYVNAAIAAKAAMTVVEMPKEQAKAEGVVGSFWEKYPDVVRVFEFKDQSGKIWSKELCGGPHVANTAELGEFGAFVLQKEESVAAGVRRIKVSLE